jgi:hypothetical protein
MSADATLADYHRVAGRGRGGGLGRVATADDWPSDQYYSHHERQSISHS